jgi:hypothetical protein
MRRWTSFCIWAAVALVGLGGRARAEPPTTIVEWIHQGGSQWSRVTLFTDGMLVWKTRDARSEKENFHSRRVTPEELDFYRLYFGRAEFFLLPQDLTSGADADTAESDAVTVTRPNGDHRTIRWDQLSSLPLAAAALRASLLGLRSSFDTALPAIEDYSPDRIPPGTVLTRRDGEPFRVRAYYEDRGILELVGVRDPITIFLALKDVRIQFLPPTAKAP